MSLIHPTNGNVKMRTFERKKRQNFKPTTLAIAIVGISLSAQSATVPISNLPLSGVDIQHSPNITLTPSVEHPTAGAAYSDNKFMSDDFPTLKLGSGDPKWEGYWKTYYQGYFDNKKCYKFSSYNSNSNEGYFYVSSLATTDSSGRVGLCSGSDEEYSGNFLNWATMSAIDIFRHTLTGGNRARGILNKEANYKNGDTPSETYLRRAYVNKHQNGQMTYRIRYRVIDIGYAPKPSDLQFLKRIIPASMVYSFTTTRDNVGLPRALGFRYLDTSQAGQLVGSNVKFQHRNKLVFLNDGFTVMPVRLTDNNALLYQDRNSIAVVHSNSTINSIVQSARKAVAGKENITAYQMPVVVKACDPNIGGVANLPKYCHQYGGNYKPEGLIQQYGRGVGKDSKPARFAVFGYQLVTGNQISGGVLRARMKYLDRTQTEGSVVYGQEWDSNTGVFVINPDTYDAAQTHVSNSGVINYVNKFGDIGSYKGNDTAAELYYTAQRYLRNKGMPAYYRNTVISNGITPSTADNFPVILDNWDDPLKRGLTSAAEAQCRSNTIILIGDTFTHDENDLPNFTSNNIKDDNEIQTASILKAILDKEKFKGLGQESWNFTRGAFSGGTKNYSPAGIVALAYWGRTNDIRKDIDGNQYINTFMIDVLENGKGRFEADDNTSLGNAYYWAAKYGGFDYAPGSVDWPNDSRGSWTKDAPGSSSSPILFPDGMPNNFALGNNPENMIEALNKAFISANTYTDPSQSAIGINDYEDSVIDVATGSTMAVQATFKARDLAGDLIGKRIGVLGGKLTFIPMWRAADLLNTAYHNTSSWSNRKVFTKNNSGLSVQFNPSNISAFESALKANNPTLSPADTVSLTKYILGDSTDEGTLWRRRSSLMGTVVNSSPRAILKPKDIPNGCTYSNPSTTLSRPIYYAAAANDGMLHIIDGHGVEKMGYIPRSALPKLYDFAKPGAIHDYLNDGAPVQAEMCFGSQAKSLLVGTAGRGGSSVYALDVTDLSSPSTSNVLWDFSSANDSDLGLTIGKPVIAKNAAGNPLVILSSGYNNTSGTGHLYILRADTTGVWTQNSNYWKIPLGNSGVGEPFVYDSDDDGIPEAVFVGDNDGKVWRINYDKSSNTWSKAYGGQPLYTPSGSGSPITGAPFVQQIGERLYVVAGTGRYFSLSDIAPTAQNYALGLFADVGPITDADLLQQSIDSNGTDVDAITSTTSSKLPQKLYTISTNPIKNTHKGWKLKLLPGQSIVAPAGIHRRRVATFTAVRSIPSVNVCGLNGATARIGVDLKNGGQYPDKLFDTNNDGNFDKNDLLGGMVEASNILSPLSTTADVMVNGKRYSVTVFSGDNGSFHMYMNPLRSNAVRRVSWREIF